MNRPNVGRIQPHPEQFQAGPNPPLPVVRLQTQPLLRPQPPVIQRPASQVRQEAPVELFKIIPAPTTEKFGLQNQGQDGAEEDIESELSQVIEGREYIKLQFCVQLYYYLYG